MKRIPVLSTIFTSLILALPTAAQAAPHGCYMRTYSAEHLTANPTQVVDWIATNFAPAQGSAGTSVRLRVQMANQSGAAHDGAGGMVMAQDLSNFSAPNSYRVDGDGGSLQITAMDASGVTFHTFGVFLSRGGDFFEDRTSTLSEGSIRPTTYRLFTAPLAACG